MAVLALGDTLEATSTWPPTADPYEKLYIVYLDNDGSRRIVWGDVARPYNPGNKPSAFIGKRDDSYAVLLGEYRDVATTKKLGRYMDYPDAGGVVAVSVDPVNQIPDLIEWKPFVATASHDVDMVLEGSQAVNDLSDEKSATLLRLAKFLIGDAWDAIVFYEGIIPTALTARIPAGETVKPLKWKHHRDAVAKTVGFVCPQCDGHGMAAEVDHDHGMWPRRWAIHANLSSYSAKLNAGHTPKTIITGSGADEEWTAHATEHHRTFVGSTAANAASLDIQVSVKELVLGQHFDAALKYYDDVIAHQRRAHSH